MSDQLHVGYILKQFVKAPYSFDAPNSYFGALKAFPGHSEVDVVLHFKTGSPSVPFPTLPDARSFQHVYHYSLSSIPETDYKPRVADDRAAQERPSRGRVLGRA